jgi:hypothetical protein
MGSIYIGGQNHKKTGGPKWKIYTFLFLFLAIIGSGLMVTAPTIVEKWLNQKGEEGTGYAFSIRDVELSLGKGQVVLTDVKIFNPKTSIELLEAPNLTIQLNWQDLILSNDKKVSVSADKVDLILSKDLSF